jgi:hypothetical protein
MVTAESKMRSFMDALLKTLSLMVESRMPSLEFFPSCAARTTPISRLQAAPSKSRKVKSQQVGSLYSETSA